MSAALEDLSMDLYPQHRREFGGSFPDLIHDRAELGSLSMAFIDTPPVQRLRHVKQLGGASFACPTAEHSRFVHSLGVGYLAGRATLGLRATGSNVRPIDIELQEVAGVCHDLGHGPFSHAFEGVFLPAVLGNHDWCHETMSARLVEYSVDEYAIDLDQHQIRSIQDIISSGDKHPPQLVWDRDDAWRLQIVANGINSVDVDKLDYLKRDARMKRVESTNDFTDLMLRDCKVIDGTICFPESKQTLVADMFNARWSMHRDVYQNVKSTAAMYMIVDILVAADPVLGISQRIYSPDEFIELDDSLVREIRRAARSNPSVCRLQKAAAILHRLEQRKLYEFVGEGTVPAEKAIGNYVPFSASDIVNHQDHGMGVMLKPDDIRVHNMKIDFCNGSADPLIHVMLYSSDGSVRPAADGRIHRPACFVNRQVQVFLSRHCSDLTQKQQYIKAAQAALTRAMQHRYGHKVEIYISPGSRRASRRAAAAAARVPKAQQQHQQQHQQQQRYTSFQHQCSPLLLLKQQQQQLDHAVSGASSSSLLGQMMQDVSPSNLQWQQQQQGLTAATTDPDLGDFVPATDDEDDVIPSSVTGDEDLSATQFSTQPGSAAATVFMQQ